MTAPPWTKAPVGTSVGMCHFPLSSTHYNFLDLGNKGRPCSCLRCATTSGTVAFSGLLVIGEHNPPTHLVAKMP